MTEVTTPMPDALEYTTADEAAECLNYHKHLPRGAADALYVKLWGFLSEAKNPTPLGGDGTNGTVEHPDGRRCLDNDDKARHWWAKLTEPERVALAAAVEDY